MSVSPFRAPKSRSNLYAVFGNKSGLRRGESSSLERSVEKGLNSRGKYITGNYCLLALICLPHHLFRLFSTPPAPVCILLLSYLLLLFANNDVCRTCIYMYIRSKRINFQKYFHCLPLPLSVDCVLCLKVCAIKWLSSKPVIKQWNSATLFYVPIIFLVAFGHILKFISLFPCCPLCSFLFFWFEEYSLSVTATLLFSQSLTHSTTAVCVIEKVLAYWVLKQHKIKRLKVESIHLGVRLT